MKAYKMMVRVGRVAGKSYGQTVWAQVLAENALQAEKMFWAMYGKANVVGVPVLAK